MMMKQSGRLALITFLIFSVAMVSTLLIAHEIIKGVTDTLPHANNAYDHFDSAKDDYTFEWVSLAILDIERAALTVSYNSNKTTMHKEALELATAATPVSALPTDLMANLKNAAGVAAKMAISYADAVSLQKALVSKTIEIQKKNADVAMDKSAMDTAYNHYVAHINAFNGSDETPSNDVEPTPKGKIPTGGGSVDTNLSVDCSNPMCSTTYSASVYGLENIVTLSEGGSSGGYKGHKETCTRDHARWDGQRVQRPASYAPSGPYWSCPPDYKRCPKFANHVEKCGGTCEEYNVYPTGVGHTANYHAMHRVACNESVPRDIWNYWTGNCVGFYYNCAGTSSCNHASNHISSTGSTPPPLGSNPPPPPPPTDNTPNCQDCTSDCSSPCDCSNSGTCGGTVSTPPPPPPPPPPTPTPTPPPPPTPPTPPIPAPPPTTVACGGAAWTGCSGASSRTEHHVPSCSHCNNSYWTCSPNVSRHTDLKTCKRSGCGATLTRCQNGPNKCNGRYHWL